METLVKVSTQLVRRRQQWKRDNGDGGYQCRSTKFGTPVCNPVPTDGSAGPEGDVVTFTPTASDDDVSSDWLTVQWSSDKDGTIGKFLYQQPMEILYLRTLVYL